MFGVHTVSVGQWGIHVHQRIEKDLGQIPEESTSDGRGCFTGWGPVNGNGMRELFL